MILTAEEARWINQQIQNLEQHIASHIGKQVKLSINQLNDALHLIVDDVIKLVSHALCMPVSLLLGRCRKQEVVMARYVCLHLIHIHAGDIHPGELANFFNRDRTTIIHAYKEIQNLIDTHNPQFHQYLNQVLNHLKTENDEQYTSKI